MAAVYIPSEPSSFKGGSVDLSGGYQSGITFIFSTLLIVLLLTALGRIFIGIYYYFFKGDGEGSKGFGKTNFVMVAQAVLFGLLMVGVVTSINASFGKDIMFTQLPNSTSAGTPGTPSTPPTTTTPPPDLGVPPPPDPTGSRNFALIMQTERAVRERLSSAGIQVTGTQTPEPCSAEFQKGCTTVGGLADRTISMVSNLKQLCGCTILIVGGTEYWSHGNEGTKTTRHMPGGGAVDIQPNTQLDNFISSANGFKAATPWSICTAAFNWNGFYFCKEKSPVHWHVE